MSKEPADAHKDFPFRKFFRRRADAPAIKWQQTLLLALVGFSATLALVLAANSLRDVDWRRLFNRPVAEVVPPKLSQMHTQQQHAIESAPTVPLSVLSPQALGRISGLRKPIWLEPPFEYLDARSFRNSSTQVVLADIDAPPRSAVCEAPDKSLWPCGIMARVALFNIIRHKPVLCEQKGREDTAPQQGTVNPGTCQVQNLNIAVELVRSGFARSVGLPSREMLEAEEEARAAGRGLWNGKWSIVQQP